MRVAIDLPEDRVNALRARAASAGLTLDAWLVRLAAGQGTAEPFGQDGGSIAHLQKKDPREWALQFRAWADGHDPSLPVLSDSAMSRESIYPDAA